MLIADNTNQLTRSKPYRFGHAPWIPLLFLLCTFAIIISIGTQDKPPKEVTWLNQLASQGDTGAQLQLGLAYLEGRYGLASNPKLGVHWLALAANAGNAYAEDAIGKAYALGEGTKPNQKLAIEWWQKALKSGNTNARWDLGKALIQEGELKQAESVLMQ